MLLSHLIDRFIETEEFNELLTRIKNKNNGPAIIEGIAASSFPMAAAAVHKAVGGQVLVVAEHSQKMRELSLDAASFADPSQIMVLPPWETLPYEFVSPTEMNERERVTAIYSVLSGKPCMVFTAVEAIVRSVPEKNYLKKRGMGLSSGEEYPFDDLIELMVSYGYVRENRVEAFGQFAVKGGIIDIFPPSYDNPLRLDFFGDTLESIREFSIESQVSIEKHMSMTLYPRRELILGSNERKIINESFHEAAAKGKEFPDHIQKQIDNNELHDISGIEDLFPLAIKEDLLISYFSDSLTVIMCEPAHIQSRLSIIEKSFHDIHLKKSKSTLCIPPERLLHPGAYDDAEQKSIVLQTVTISPNSLRWQLKSIPGYRGRIKQVRDDISARSTSGWKSIITTGFEGQARRLYDLLGEFNPSSNFEMISDEPVSICITPLHEGIEIHQLKTSIITDHEIFGKSYRKKRQFKSSMSRPIDSFLDLKSGDYVVHINHGIGTFKKIERMSAGGVERDFLMIEYADSDVLYVSLDQITLVQKYIGIEGKKPRIDHLGKKSSWNKVKERVRESIEEIATELVKIHAARTSQKGFQYPPDTAWQEEFEAMFEYEETPDQITAIEDVKDDMENPKPMDRLICGDVGFGKTEVAIRASFKAVMAGRQVAVLVPTTVLAMQHFNTFSKRFSDYPVKVEMLSRFKSAGEVKDIKARLIQGSIDIIIGTHALLSKDMAIKNLGLLIIDEEQRFGVKHKEQLKKLRALVDVMTLSATPIPRTMHMALAGMRDLSVIMTAPENRQSIETYVMEENPDILRNAVLSEIERGGQVFYVHNRVQTIDAQAMMLRKLVPEAGICVAHGQMHEHELEQVLIDFLEQRHDILVSTSIIESGLDMPNVNTIIINRSDTFGLSQLYQLKGRVGRSIKKAYAYLFYPRHTSLTEDAEKRLQVISEYSELGSGFKIAMKDLEIRGAGNILGREQSGNIMEVGFDLYLSMLDSAVRELKGETNNLSVRTPVFLKTDFFIPDQYISDEKQKIEFYKRFESCETEDEINKIESEMLDRFGPYPDRVSVLINIERIRVIASLLALDEILEDSRQIKIRISSNAKIDVKPFLNIVRSDKRCSIDNNDNQLLLFKPESKTGEKKAEELKKWLQQIISSNSIP